MRQDRRDTRGQACFGVTTLCHIWRVQRRDGEAFRVYRPRSPTLSEDASAGFREASALA